MWKYNHDRPNMALGGITPKQRWPWLHNCSTSRFSAEVGDYRVPTALALPSTLFALPTARKLSILDFGWTAQACQKSTDLCLLGMC